MPLKPSKNLMFLSGNGNSPSNQIKLGLFHIELHIHDVMSIFKLLFGVIALIYWIKNLDKSLDEKKEAVSDQE